MPRSGQLFLGPASMKGSCGPARGFAHGAGPEGTTIHV